MMTVLGIILIIVSVALVVLVVLQEGKGRGLSGAISLRVFSTFSSASGYLKYTFLSSIVPDL